MRKLAIALCLMVAASMPTSASAQSAEVLKALSDTKASALSVGLLSVQIMLSTRPEVTQGLLQPPLVYSESGGPIWISSWMGLRTPGTTFRERCRGIVESLRYMMGASGDKVTDYLRANLESIGLVGSGTKMTEPSATELAKAIRLRGVVALPQAVGSCESGVLDSAITFTPSADANWDRTVQ